MLWAGRGLPPEEIHICAVPYIAAVFIREVVSRDATPRHGVYLGAKRYPRKI